MAYDTVSPDIDNDAPWELACGNELIRTLTGVNPRGGMTGGLIVAQFWTRPKPEHALLMAAAPELLRAVQLLHPSHCSPGCWCARGRDIDGYGHEPGCLMAQVALKKAGVP